MKLFAVFDSQGSGRIVGIFDTLEKAERVVQVHPHYYSLYEYEMNRINPEAFYWLPIKQRKELKNLIKTIY